MLELAFAPRNEGERVARGELAEAGVLAGADASLGSRSGRNGLLDDSSRSAIDQNRIVTPQLLQDAACPKTAGG